jgi:signal transduction histidine kinase
VLAAQRAHAGALVAGSMLSELERSIIPLQGYAARLSEISGDERVEKYRTYIDREMDRLISHASEVTRFLENSFAPVRRPVSLRELLRELEAMLWVDCRTYGIGFGIDMPDDIRVGVDKELVLSALEKLFRNSREAMPEGGSFTLTVHRDSAERVVIEASDTGKGIQAKPVERVFEPFFTSGSAHGAGLGLSIARRIIELHGGSISAANRADQRGGGALLTITLPVI